MRRSARRSLAALVASLCCAALGLSACGGSSGGGESSGGPVKLNVSYSEPVADILPLWIGIDAGIFSKHGLQVTSQQITSTNNVAALLSRQVPFAFVGGSEVLSAAAQGGDLSVIGMATPVYPYVFYSNPAISDAQGLKGKKVAITKAGANLDISCRVALQRLGVEPDKDVSMIPTGSVPNVTSALLTGQVAGSVSHPPESLQLEAKGFHPLYDLAKQKIPYGAVGVTTTKAYVSSHKDVTQRFVDGLLEAIQRERTDKQLSMRVLGKYIKEQDPERLSRTYDFYAGEVVQSLPYPKPAMFQQAQQTLGRKDSKVRSYQVDKLLDSSFLNDASRRGLGKAA
jgi:ABC-type nitrate/sulfonate/bicarbonate transport system substrate-binding protein